MNWQTFMILSLKDYYRELYCFDLDCEQWIAGVVEWAFPIMKLPRNPGFRALEWAFPQKPGSRVSFPPGGKAHSRAGESQGKFHSRARLPPGMTYSINSCRVRLPPIARLPLYIYSRYTTMHYFTEIFKIPKPIQQDIDAFSESSIKINWRKRWIKHLGINESF